MTKRTKAKPRCECIRRNGQHAAWCPVRPTSRPPKRTKAKRIEAWAVWDNPPAPGDSGREGFQSELHASKGDAYEVANRYDAGECNVVHLVPADPLARLKEDVLRAARKVWRTAGLNTDPKWLRAVHELEGAVERLERRTPTERK